MTALLPLEVPMTLVNVAHITHTHSSSKQVGHFTLFFIFLFAFLLDGNIRLWIWYASLELCLLCSRVSQRESKISQIWALYVKICHKSDMWWSIKCLSYTFIFSQLKLHFIFFYSCIIIYYFYYVNLYYINFVKYII